MKKLALAAALLLLLPVLIAAGPISRPFSADYVSKQAKGPETVTKMWLGGSDRWRIEMPKEQGGAVNIVRTDRKVMYTVLPAQKIYYEMPLTGDDLSPTPEPPRRSKGAKVEQKALGWEKVTGYQCEKYVVSIVEPGKKPRSHFLWKCKEVGWPLKMAAVDGAWSMEYRNLKVGPQDPKLFEPPAGYKKLSMPGMMKRR